ncbi:MAG: cupin domain-containing protein, partial [Thermoanaerobaculia bacterium]
MTAAAGPALELTNHHTGEILALRRIPRGGEIWLEMQGSLPPHREGPPLHVHFVEDEEGTIRAGTISAVVDGREFTAGPGAKLSSPRGAA